MLRKHRRMWLRSVSFQGERLVIERDPYWWSMAERRLALQGLRVGGIR